MLGAGQITRDFFVNADDIALAEGISEIQAGLKAIEKFNGFAESGSTFCFETTLAGSSNQRRIQEIKDRYGYKVVSVFVWLRSAELSAARVTQRAITVKHYIPLERLLERHPKNAKNFIDDIMPVSVFWVIVDNSGLLPELVGYGGKGIPKSGDHFLTEDEAVSTRFLDFYKHLNDPCLVNKYNRLSAKEVDIKPTRGDSWALRLLGDSREKVHQDISSRPKGTTCVYLSPDITPVMK
jgi:predicted ABC-type ATPase